MTGAIPNTDSRPLANYDALIAYCAARERQNLTEISKRFDGRPDFLESTQPLFAPINWTSRVSGVSSLDQGDVAYNATCTSFAMAVLITDIISLHGHPGPLISPFHLHACLAGCTENVAIAPDVLMSVVQNQRLAAMTPNEPYPVPGGACPHVAVQTRLVRGDEIRTVDTKSALSQTPLLAQIRPPDAFWTFRGAVFSDPTPSGQPHSVELLGWDKDGWFIRNSQGTAWGQGGFCKITNGSCGFVADGPILGSHRLQIA